MKVYGTKVIPPVAEKRVTECTHAVCDMCGVAKTSEAPTSYSGECNWAKKAYEVMNTTVVMVQGDCYPEGGNECMIQAQVCPECFDTKLLPFIRSFQNTVDNEMFPTKEQYDF